MLESLASEATDYISIQMRRTGNHEVNIQVCGPEDNRTYGFAVRVTAPTRFTDWLANQDAHAPSLARTGEMYTFAQATIRDGVCHIQVSGTELNRPYGAALDVENPELVDYVNSSIEDEEEEQDFDLVLSD